MCVCCVSAGEGGGLEEADFFTMNLNLKNNHLFFLVGGRGRRGARLSDFFRGGGGGREWEGWEAGGQSK